MKSLFRKYSLLLLFLITASFLGWSKVEGEQSPNETAEEIARKFSKEGKYQEAISEIETILKKAIQEKNSSLEADAHFYLGILNYNRVIKAKKLRFDHEVSAQAIKHLKKALEIYKELHDSSHPNVFKTLECLAIVALHDWDANYAEMALAGREEYISTKFPDLSKEERMSFQKNHKPFDFIFNTRATDILANTVLRHKGIVLDSILEDREFDGLIEKIQESSSLNLSGLERNDKRRRALAVTHHQVRNRMPPQSCLVEFVKHLSMAQGIGFNKTEYVYTAIIIPQNQEEEIVKVALGDAQNIEAKIDDFLQWIQIQDSAAFPKEVIPQIYNLVISPILKNMPSDTERIIISPDAKLSFVPFGALYPKNSIFDLESFFQKYSFIHYLPLILIWLIFLKRDLWQIRAQPFITVIYGSEIFFVLLFLGVDYGEDKNTIFLFFSLLFLIGIISKFSIAIQTPNFTNQYSFFIISTVFTCLAYVPAATNGHWRYLNAIQEIFYVPSLFNSLGICGQGALWALFILTSYCIPFWLLIRFFAVRFKEKPNTLNWTLISIYWLCTFLLSAWIFYGDNPLFAMSLNKNRGIIFLISFLVYLIYFTSFLWIKKNHTKEEPYLKLFLCSVKLLPLPLVIWLCNYKLPNQIFDWEKGRTGSFLCEEYDISYVATGRDLLDQFSSLPRDKKALVIANPRYLLEEKSEPPPEQSLALSKAASGADLEVIRNLKFAPLPGTQKEAERLHPLLEKNGFSVTQLIGEKATESNLYLASENTPHILHLATHGFFVGNRKKLGDNLGQSRFFSSAENPSALLDDPMKRAGLALTGAKSTFTALEKGNRTRNSNDGILTAREAAELDLRNNWLTTLSACETGAGESQDGEGVLGLRRAFAQAGTQNLLLTLWPVSDDRTVDFMQAFYECALNSGDIPGSLTKIQKEFLVNYREEESLARAIRYFAPFILTFRGSSPE